MKNKNLFKKIVFLTMIILCTISSYSQNRTEKWNEWSKRYEYFDSRGTLVGYKIYNNYKRQWEYYDLTQNENSRNPQRATSVDYGIQVAGMLQARYDSNMAEIQRLINEFRQKTISSSENAPNKIEEEAWIHAGYDFQVLYVEKFMNNTGDLSSRNRTEKIKTWLTNAYNNLVLKYVINNEKFELIKN